MAGKTIRVAVVGGGAAGLMSAVYAAKNGADVTLFEKNRSAKRLDSERFYDNAYLGKKLLITGKGRCNVTNACNATAFQESVLANPKFLYAAFDAFPPEKVMDFFENGGTPLKVERGNRVFPVSDKALDVLRVFKKALKEQNVTVTNQKVTDVKKPDEAFRVSTEDGKTSEFDRVIICTGGVSYPQTGSDGDGYTFAKNFGHTVTDLLPSLVPLECERADLCSAMAGLSLKNVTLTVTDTVKKKTVYSELGEMLFTHFGVSGPLVLSASAHMRKQTADKYVASIDLKPGMTRDEIDARLLKIFTANPAKILTNLLGEMLPHSMILPFCDMAKVNPETRAGSVTKADRAALVETFKAFTLAITAFRPIAEAIVTAGGVKVKEVNPSTMESKIVPGLYFAGEILDLDAYTGGFNLQIAFSTGYLSGTNSAKI